MWTLFAVVAAWAADSAVSETITAEEPAKTGFFSRPLSCERYLGIAAGAYTGNNDWERLNVGWGPTGSPAIVLNCGIQASDHWRVSLGLESAPWFAIVRPDGELRHQWATATTTVWYGGEKFRMGANFTAGYSAIGPGVTAHVALQRVVVEGRLSAFLVGSPSLQALVTMRIPKAQR